MGIREKPNVFDSINRLAEIELVALYLQLSMVSPLGNFAPNTFNDLSFLAASPGSVFSGFQRQN